MGYADLKARALALADGQEFAQWISECQLNGIEKAILQDWHKWKAAGELKAELNRGDNGFTLHVKGVS